MHEKTPAAEEWAARKDRVEAHLAAIVGAPVPGEPSLRVAIRESVLSPGKRLRPLMVDVAARDLDFDGPAALQAGCALELVHTASLLLDDLPCMDDALVRRGRPAAHIRFGEDVAILASIGLLGEAFGLLARLDGASGEQRSALSAALAEAVGARGLVGGQFSDLRSGGGGALAINDGKTGSLFVAGAEMAAVLARAAEGTREPLRAFALELGRAFQLFDDLLDVAGDPARMGKDTGKDTGKAVLAQAAAAGEVADEIEAHLAAAHRQLARLPNGAPRLSGFTRMLFGNLASLQTGDRADSLLPRLLA